MGLIHGEMSALLTYPGGSCLDFLGLDNLVALNIIHFGHFADPLKNSGGELASVALEMAIENMTNPAIIIQVGVLGMSSFEKVVMII